MRDWDERIARAENQVRWYEKWYRAALSALEKVNPLHGVGLCGRGE